MSFLGACCSVVIATFLMTLAGLLSFRVLTSLFPGGWGLTLRRRLFLWTQPVLEPLSGWFGHRTGGFDWPALALAVVCFLVAKGLAPWLAWMGFRLSAGS
jgi:uncharacterized protein YggT (Ycf19 family)